MVKYLYITKKKNSTHPYFCFIKKSDSVETPQLINKQKRKQVNKWVLIAKNALV